MVPSDLRLPRAGGGLSLVIFGAILVGLGLLLSAGLPSSDRRFKTGYKGNAAAPSGAYLLATLGFWVAGGTLIYFGVQDDGREAARLASLVVVTPPDLAVPLDLSAPDLARRRHRRAVHRESEPPVPVKVPPDPRTDNLLRDVLGE